MQSSNLFLVPELRPEAAHSIVESFQGKRVLVVGDLMLDEYLVGEVRRISPEAPVPVVDITHRAHVPGGACNVAANIASLGGRPVLLGLTGKDENASWLKAVLESQNVPTGAMISASDRATITKTRIVSGQQQIVRIDREVKTPVTGLLAEQVIRTYADLIPNVDACILSDYAKGLLTPTICQVMIKLATQLNKPLVVDPKGLDFKKYAGCTVMTPNMREAELVGGGVAPQTDEELVVVAERLRSILGVSSAVLITRGADGMTLFRQGKQPSHTRALAREVFDVTGAGDTVGSTLTLALAAGAGMSDAMLLSNLAASVVVQKTGTATLTSEELQRAADNESDAGRTELKRATAAGASRSYLAVANQTQLM